MQDQQQQQFSTLSTTPPLKASGVSHHQHSRIRRWHRSALNRQGHRRRWAI